MSTKLTILKGFLLEDMFHWLIFIVDFFSCALQQFALHSK